MKKTKFFLPVVTASLLLSMGLVACNKGADNGSGNQSTTSQQSSQQEKITITAAGDKKTLELNGTVQLTASVEGVTWATSDKAVLTVSDSGLVTAVGYGEASITAKKEGYKNGSIGIKVERPAPIATFDLTTAADHYSADGWWELPAGGFAMQVVTGWNPISQTMSYGQTEETPETFVGGFGTGDKETVKFNASAAGKAELMLNIGNSDEAVLAEIMTVKLNGTAVNLAEKKLEEHPGDWGNSLEFSDLSLGFVDLAASNTLEFAFLKDTNIFLNEVSLYAKGMTATLVEPTAKEQITVTSAALEVIEGETVAIQTSVAGVSYVSVNEETATVDASGVVTGVKVGITNITVKKEGMYSVRVEITVKPKPVEGQILVEAELAEELQGETIPTGAYVARDGQGGFGGSTEVHSGSAYLSFYGASEAITLTYKFNAPAAKKMAFSVVGAAPVNFGGESAAYVIKDSMTISVNGAAYTPAADAQFPAPEGWSATMSEVALGDIDVKAGENTLVITLSEVFPSLDVFKISQK